MARATKVLVRPGVYSAPQGELRATEARVKRWANQFHEMRARGIKIPIGWGHQPNAWPKDPHETDRARQQYHLSAYNAGYLDDMTFRNGGLASVLNCPGLELEGDNLVHWIRLPDGREVKSAIGEVSVAIKDWRDGTGRLWEDAIIHVALTPLPVAHNTGGFGPITSAVCNEHGEAITLSLSSLLYTLAGDTDVAEKKDPPFEKKDGDTEGGGNKDHFAEGIEFLTRQGISLPDDTTAENFWERLCVAGHALENADKDGDGDVDLDELDDTPEEPEVSYSGEDDASVEEQRPVMMSLATAKTASERRLIEREQERHKKAQLARLEKLIKRGLKPEKAQKLRERIDGYTLSLTEDGEVVEKGVDFLLSSLEDMTPEKHPLTNGRLKGTRRAPRPDRQRERPESEEEINRRAASVSARP